MIENIIARINELYHKSQKEGLTPEEKEEQAALRKEYIASVKRNLKGQLDNIDMVNADGTVTNLGEKYGNKPYSPAQSGYDQENGCRRVYLHANGLENHPQDREYCKRRIPKDMSEYQYLGNLSESTKLFLLLSPWERSFFIAFF